MAVEKKITKTTVKKTVVKKAAVAKPVAPKAVAKKAPAVKSNAKKQMVPQERFYAMVSEAAYFAAQNDSNQRGAVAYWMDAEAAMRAKFDVA